MDRRKARIETSALPVAPLVAVLMAAGVSACDSTSSALPEEFLGTWFFIESSGGLSGAGTREESEGHIAIGDDNTMRFYDGDENLTGSETFTVSRGRTIFAPEDLWIIHRGRSAEAIVVSEGGDTLTLRDNVFDGLHRTYARSRSNCGDLAQQPMNKCHQYQSESLDLVLRALVGELESKYDPARVAQLRGIQEAWLRFRRDACAFEAAAYDGGSVAPTVAALCSIRETTRRIETLAPLLCEGGLPTCEDARQFVADPTPRSSGEYKR